MDISQLIKRRPCRTAQECTAALREVIQEIALLGLWRAKFFDHAAFYGGTALRVLHGINRFSEDLDFSLLRPDHAFSLEPYNRAIKEELESFNFDVSIERKIKSQETPIESAFIKTTTQIELLKIGLDRLNFKELHPDTSLKVKLEVDTDPPPGFNTNAFLLSEPTAVMIRAYDLPDLFAGKMHALLCRKWKHRVKGRDWYDFAWLVFQKVPLRISYLEKRMKESGELDSKSSLNENTLLTWLENKIENLDVEKALKDVSPFIFDRAAISAWSKDFFHEVVRKMKFKLD